MYHLPQENKTKINKAQTKIKQSKPTKHNAMQ